MAFHPLPDWRMAGDMLALIAGRVLEPKDWAEREARLAEKFAADFKGSAVEVDGGVAAVTFDDRTAVIVSHPLEETESNVGRRLALATADIEGRGYGSSAGRPIVPFTSFDFVRRPGWIYSELFQPR